MKTTRLTEIFKLLIHLLKLFMMVFTALPWMPEVFSLASGEERQKRVECCGLRDAPGYRFAVAAFFYCMPQNMLALFFFLRNKLTIRAERLLALIFLIC